MGTLTAAIRADAGTSGLAEGVSCARNHCKVTEELKDSYDEQRVHSNGHTKALLPQSQQTRSRGHCTGVQAMATSLHGWATSDWHHPQPWEQDSKEKTPLPLRQHPELREV